MSLQQITENIGVDGNFGYYHKIKKAEHTTLKTISRVTPDNPACVGRSKLSKKSKKLEVLPNN